jgi:hypothetical protein
MQFLKDASRWQRRVDSMTVTIRRGNPIRIEIKNQRCIAVAVRRTARMLTPKGSSVAMVGQGFLRDPRFWWVARWEVGVFSGSIGDCPQSDNGCSCLRISQTLIDVGKGGGES